MYSQIGARAYQQIGLESAVMSANPHQLVTMLFDGALSALVRSYCRERGSTVESNKYHRQWFKGWLEYGDRRSAFREPCCTV